MNVMDLFRGFTGGNTNQQQAAQQPQQPVQPTPGNLPANEPPMLQNMQQGQLAPVQQTNEKPPLDEFKGLWDLPKPVDGAFVDAPISFNVDPAKVRQSAKQVDFTKQVTPALMQQVMAGGEGAAQAMVQMMNEMAQAVFAESASVSTKILEGGLEASHKRVQATLPTAVRKHTIGQALREDNPLFNNPATAPMLQMLESQLLTQFPTATPAQIKEHAQNYLTQFASSIQGQQPKEVTPMDARGKEIDWSSVPIQ